MSRLAKINIAGLLKSSLGWFFAVICAVFVYFAVNALTLDYKKTGVRLVLWAELSFLFLYLRQQNRARFLQRVIAITSLGMVALLIFVLILFLYNPKAGFSSNFKWIFFYYGIGTPLGVLFYFIHHKSHRQS
ncbi:hypothetical protein SAMN02745664_1238 [Moraxella cuniculi DSM 21768]|uniref:Uncharacterized protein n=1 Tax=Moraxella cuniculi DSM 21768 TaxID=1122245 RepID=A0A1N7G3Z5_9GAMM|nr:hypothetical protein [Moraxella cuniculi]OOS03276.1 hypothetical protein B0189_09750 [Moraxella cuniculi]SIS07281.1 hypothetical protein SAMN02745664_1238 [Moraxella cuniculi DSM 21768]